MKFSVIFSVVALPILGLLGGCAAAEEPVSASDSDLAVASKVHLDTSSARESVQARLYTLLETFKGDAELGIAAGSDRDALGMAGTLEAGVARSIACSTSSMELVAPGGGGFMHRDLFECDLVGFNRIRNGAVLPRVNVGFELNTVLAGKLYTLLEKGAEKGGLGVVQTDANDHPPCCDMPTKSTYEIGDANAKLSCTLHGGGFTGRLSAECTYARAIRPNE